MAYYPNGTAGEYLENQCIECIHGQADDVGCPVAFVQTSYNYRQLDDGKEKLKECMTLLINDSGDCQVKVLIDRFYEPKVDPR